MVDEEGVVWHVFESGSEPEDAEEDEGVEDMLRRMRGVVRLAYLIIHAICHSSHDYANMALWRQCDPGAEEYPALAAVAGAISI